MTARHATPIVTTELETAGGARQLILRDRTDDGYAVLILDLRPSARSSPLTATNVEVWTLGRLALGTLHLTATQLRAAAALFGAAAQEAEGRE